MSVPAAYRQWFYVRPQVGDDALSVDHFALRERPIPELGPDQALVRVKLINIHSNTRRRLVLGQTPLGETERANYACAEVIASRDPAFKEGDLIACQAAWQDFQVISSLDPAIGYGPVTPATKALNHTNCQWTYVFRPQMAQAWPADVLMDVFGTSGMTAYFGMRQCGPIAPGDQVLTAAATGSVGSLAAQLAKIAGARVVGLAGGEDRCAWAMETLGLDACVDYRAPDLPARLRRALPSGVDLFSDGVGGALTRTAVEMMNRGGRLFAYGGSADFYAREITAPPRGQTMRTMFGVTDEIEALLKAKDARAEAWIVDAFYHERLEAEDALSELLRSGALKPVNAVFDGFETLPQAVVALYAQPHAGKLQVRFAPD